MPRMYDSHISGQWSNYSRSWESSPNTTETTLRWDEKKGKFVGEAQLWRCNPPTEIEIDYTENYIEYIESGEWLIYISYSPDWKTQEAIAIALGKNTLRHKGWCIIHKNPPYVDFYDMETEEKITWDVVEFGAHRFYYEHFKNDKSHNRKTFVDCCHDCFP